MTFIDMVRANLRPGMCVAEVGVWTGETSAHWVPIVSRVGGTAILVDNFMGNPTTSNGPHTYSGKLRDDVRTFMRERIEAWNSIGKYAKLLEGDSIEMVQRVPDQSIDICFIDADHRYSKVSEDIKVWKLKVAQNGILCGHDCDGFDYDERYIEMDFMDGKHHGVIKAVNEQSERVIRIGETCWIMRVDHAQT